MIDTSKSFIHHGDKKVDKIYQGTSSSPVYNWEVGWIATGEMETIPYENTFINNPSLFHWESYTVPGRNGSRIPKAMSNLVNGRRLGDLWNHSYDIISEPVDDIRFVGTKSLSSYTEVGEKTRSVVNADATHPLKRRIRFDYYKWPTNTEIVVTYRVTQNPGSKVMLRMKQTDTNLVNFGTQQPVMDHTDTDGSGIPLHIVQVTYNSSSTNYFGEYIDLFFEKNIGEVYDINIYMENAVRKKVLTNQNTSAKVSNLNSGWIVDARDNSIFMRSGNSVLYMPNTSSYAPYIAIKLDKPVKRGERWVFLARLKGTFPDSHSLNFELGSTLTWSTSGRTHLSRHPKSYNGEYLIYQDITYNSNTNANYLYITLRGDGPIGTGYKLELNADIGIVAINLTEDSQEDLSNNEILTNITEYKEVYDLEVDGKPVDNIIGAARVFRSYTSSSNGELYYNHMSPYIKAIDNNAYYILKTRTPAGNYINVYIVRGSDNSWKTNGMRIEAGSTGGIVVKGSEIITDSAFNSGLATNWGYQTATPPDNRYLELLKIT